MCAAQARQAPPPPPTPPHKGRAIACGNFGFESCVRERGWIPKLRARPDFDSDVAPVRRKLATCDCPATRGRGTPPSSRRRRGHTQRAAVTAPALSTRSLDKSFGSLAVARDVELSLPHGERYALIGQ